MIYENIKKYCEKENISIAELERRAGLSKNAIGKWQKSAPSVPNLKKVADYFNTTMDELMK